MKYLAHTPVMRRAAVPAALINAGRKPYPGESDPVVRRGLDSGSPDDGLDFFRGLVFALLFEAVGVLFALVVWWFAWAVLP